jgi:hypothetical protein
MLATIGMEAFAERACKELQATGEKVRRRTAATDRHRASVSSSSLTVVEAASLMARPRRAA